MANSTSMSYGAFDLSPVPFMNISKQYIKSPDQINRGVTQTVTLSGTIAQMDSAAGVAATMAAKDDLKEAFNQDGKYFKVMCDDTVILECYPRVTNIQFSESNNNWVFTIPYSITLEYEMEPVDVGIVGSGEDYPGLHPPYISDFTEDWNVEFAPDQSNPYSGIGGDVNPYVARVTHNINAVGKSHYNGPGLTGTLEKPAWQQARDYVTGLAGIDNEKFYAQGALNLPTGVGDWEFYDHYRVANIGETNGSYSIQENWLVLGPRGTGVARKAVEDFNIDVSDDINADNASVSIQGTIQGLEERVYTGPDQFDVTGYKYDNAKDYFDEIKSSIIFGRCGAAATHCGIGTLNPEALVKTIGHSYNQGTITYSYNFDTRAPNCINGARFENIDVQDSNPTDVFSTITIMGRAQGPILQDFNTVTEATRTVNFDVAMEPPTGTGTVAALFMNNPRDQVAEKLCMFEADLTGTANNVVKKSADSESWNPKTGRYNRSVTWTYVSCDTAVNTSLCAE